MDKDLQPSPTPLKDGIDKIGRGGEGFELEGGRDSAGHLGGTVEAFKEVGKGWSVGAAASWFKDAGYAVWGKIVWSPKSK